MGGIRSKDGSSVSVTMRLSRDANQALRRMSGYAQGMGRMVSELILVEQARRQEREAAAAKTLAKKEAG